MPSRLTVTASHAELLGRLVLELEDPQWSFRTVPGLARSLDLPVWEVEALLDRYQRLVRWLPVCDEDGNQLLTGSFCRSSWRERLIRLRAYMARTDLDFA